MTQETLTPSRILRKGDIATINWGRNPHTETHGTFLLWGADKSKENAEVVTLLPGSKIEFPSGAGVRQHGASASGWGDLPPGVYEVCAHPNDPHCLLAIKAGDVSIPFRSLDNPIFRVTEDPAT